MENATQALLIAGGVLIALMVLALGVFIFKSASVIGENYEMTVSETEVLKFNARFAKYEKKPDYVYLDYANENVRVEAKDIKKNSYTVAMYNYNTISDVVSAINLAYDENEKVEYDEQVGIQVWINLSELSDNPLGKKIIGINPVGQQDNRIRNEVFELDPTTARGKKLKYSSSGTGISINELLAKFKENKLIQRNNGENLRVYKYCFEGQLHINETTQLVDDVYFKLIDNKAY